VTWTSSNSTIASVNTNGVVTANASGTAIITATAASQDANGNEIKATCAVTVTNPATSIKFDKDTMLMRVDGLPRQLTVIRTPTDADADFNWASSNVNVVTVDQTGLVTPVAPGKATVTAVTKDGLRVATCEVTVSPNTTPITGITLSATTLTINGSDKGTLTVTLAPVNTTDQDVTWTSSDEDIAKITGTGLTVDINPVAPTAAPTPPATGDRTVTITVKSNADATKTVSCTVTIKYVPTTSVTISPASLEFASIAAETQKLNATVSPANASIKTVTWKVDTAATAGIVAVNSVTGVVSPLDVGTTKIIATTADAITATCNVEVK
jgi:uncharacterized protein YjdB